MKFIEISNFGINTLTFVFIVTILLTLFQGRALIKQNIRIVRNESGDSVNFVFISYYTFTALAIIAYGIEVKSLALTINGFLGFLALIIIFNLLRFKKISLREKVFGFGSAIVLPLIIFVQVKEPLILIFGLAFGVALLFQIIEIWQNRNSGSVDPNLIGVSLFSCFFWFVYALIMGIWPMEVINFVGLLLWLILLISYLKFKPESVVI